MEEKNFLDKVVSILKQTNKEYTLIPTLLQETFDRLIEQRTLEEPGEYNDCQPTMFLEEDIEGNVFLSYINRNGEKLQILDGSKEYKELEQGIKVKVSTFLHEFGRIMKAKELELAEITKVKQDEIFRKVQSGEMELSEFADYSMRFAKQLADIKSPAEYLDRILNIYAQKIGENNIYSMSCSIAEGEGKKKGPRVNKTPIKEAKDEFRLEHRLEGIEKVIPIYDLIVINNGEYHAYVYDLENNKNNEKGYMMVVEPNKNEGISTRMVYLSQKEFESLKEKNENKGDLEIKAMHLKSILEDREKLEQVARINHREYGKWLAIINYYLKGTKQIEPEILELIEDETFKKRFPRGYLKGSRRELLGDDERG